jgi:hypothetical protein
MSRRRMCGGRAWLALAALALAVPLMWSAGGCRSSQPQLIPQAPLMPNNVMDLPTIMSFVRADAGTWDTLTADCSVVIASPQFATGIRQVSFSHGRIMIQKPGQIKLEAVEGQKRIYLVGDGKQYRVDLPVFRDAYEGSYGDPLPAQPRRILVMPDDVVTAWDWTGMMVGKVPVLKNLPGGALIDLLDMVSEPTPQVQASGEVAFDRAQRRITSGTKYNKDTTVRVQIVVRQTETVEGPEKQPARVPSQVWLSYEGDSIQITLRNIEVGKKFPEGSFDVKS